MTPGEMQNPAAPFLDQRVVEIPAARQSLDSNSLSYREFHGLLRPKPAAKIDSTTSQQESRNSPHDVKSQHANEILIAALENAAQAHPRCAEADRFVALEYAKIAQAG